MPRQDCPRRNSTPPFPLDKWPRDISQEERLTWFAAYLQREPDNPYDTNAVAASSQHGIVGYLPRERAKAYGKVLELLESQGHRRAACPAFARRADNGMWGVVLALSSSRDCMSYVKADKTFRS